MSMSMGMRGGRRNSAETVSAAAVAAAAASSAEAAAEPITRMEWLRRTVTRNWKEQQPFHEILFAARSGLRDALALHRVVLVLVSSRTARHRLAQATAVNALLFFGW
jgi:hypothetical protein